MKKRKRVRKPDIHKVGTLIHFTVNGPTEENVLANPSDSIYVESMTIKEAEDLISWLTRYIAWAAQKRTQPSGRAKRAIAWAQERKK